jgi:hypothetical protein
MITGRSLADGQLASSKATLYTVAVSTVAHVAHIFLTNTTASALTVNIYLKRSGSTSRKILDTYSLAAHASYVVPFGGSAVRLSAGDLIEGDASAATSIDYFIDGGTEPA